ncbi:MAG: serine/threonine-protein kinase [Polyangiaceae bacterium]
MSASRTSPETEHRVLAEKYALLRKIGEGTNGVVYEAEHLIVGKRVAVKLLRCRVAEDTAARTRFVAETRAAARIAHPNVVGIDDLGISNEGVPYIVMEMLEGETLAELTQRRGALSVMQAAEIVLQVLTGLSAAHRKGLIHGDLRPHNVMVMHPRSDQTWVKVLDFGASRALPESATFSAAAPADKSGFRAPEQVGHDSVDERSDVYAAAAILRGLLRADGDVPRPLAELVERGLAPKRADRIGSAEEFAEQLRTIINSAPPSVPHSARNTHTHVPVVARRAPGMDASKPPAAAAMQLNLSPRLVTDSLLMSPRLPKAPAPPKLEAGKDFLPMLDDPERHADEEQRSQETRLPESKRRGLDTRPALIAMSVGFGIGIVIAWAAGLI